MQTTPAALAAADARTNDELLVLGVASTTGGFGADLRCARLTCRAAYYLDPLLRATSARIAFGPRRTMELEAAAANAHPLLQRVVERYENAYKLPDRPAGIVYPEQPSGLL